MMKFVQPSFYVMRIRMKQSFFTEDVRNACQPLKNMQRRTGKIPEPSRLAIQSVDKPAELN